MPLSPALNSVSADEIQDLMFRIRDMVVEIHEENLYWKNKLNAPISNVMHNRPIQSPTENEISTTTTISSGTLSTPATSSTCPPPYKSAVKLISKQPIENHSQYNNSYSQHRHQNHIQQQRSLTVPRSNLNQEDIPPQPPIRTRRRSKTLSSTTYTSTSRENMSASRGALIVFEGLDRVGKSTLAKKLVEHFKRVNRPVRLMRFPERSSPVGTVIDHYLRSKSKQVDNHTMHLLFSANRWEFNTQIRQSLLEGETVVIDRYSYSGIAYSCAKKGLTIDWCCEPEKGLPQPDLVIFLELPKEAQYKRQGFGEERFETEEMQELVRLQYEKVMEKSGEIWLRVDVEDKSPDQILGEIISPIKRRIEACASKEIGTLEFLSSTDETSSH